MSSTGKGDPASLDQVANLGENLFGGGTDETDQSNNEKPDSENKDETQEKLGGDQVAPDDGKENGDGNSNNGNSSGDNNENNAEENDEKTNDAEKSTENEAIISEKGESAQDNKNNENEESPKLQNQMNAIAGELFDGNENQENEEEKAKESENSPSEVRESEENNESSKLENQVDSIAGALASGAEGEPTNEEKPESEERLESEEKQESEADKTSEEDESKLENNTNAIAGALLSDANEDENNNENESENNDDENESEQPMSPIKEPPARLSKTTPPRRSPRFANTQPISYQEFSEEEMNKAIDNLLTKNKPIESEMVPAIKIYIEEELRDAALNKKYEYGAKLEKADRLIDQSNQTDEAAILQEKRRQEAEERHAIAKERYETTTKEWNEKIAKYRADQQDRVAELEAEHKKQIEDFERQWADPNNMTEYNKPSAALIRLRTVEENLALQKQFDRAKEVQKQADKLQKEEMVEAQRRAVIDMRHAYEAMDQRQRREMECLLQHTQRNIEFMERERDKSTKPMSVVVQRHHENARPKTQRSRSLYNDAMMSPTTSSPRPIRTKLTATTLRPTPGLGVNGINVKQFIKPRKSSTPSSPKKKKSE
ncbi:hypothetical protein TRFO_26925 [Tritrichomonas foetus]|uniref:Uncharacterized protein n=1 Tax=Tritrichomonas foetus TaxID=1144522 RepID=A0A1J4K6G2_9EUKA|nr:hypothetical protein TRFO_26925 [Tritrichomonas foetus]|eukprot:OHT05308.1 hypothetical protein TRFO_26925 [Tritrichomonas foetus]